MIMQKIQKVAETFSGYTFRDGIQSSDAGELKVIQAKNIEELTDLKVLISVERFPNDEKYFLRNKDILIISKGMTNTVNMLNLDSNDKFVIASAAFIIIRANKDIVDPSFLTWYLQLPETQELLKSFQRISTVPNLSIKAILDLNIPILPMEKQQKLGQLHQLHQKRKHIHSILEKKRSTLIDMQLLNILKDE